MTENKGKYKLVYKKGEKKFEEEYDTLEKLGDAYYGLLNTDAYQMVAYLPSGEILIAQPSFWNNTR